MRSKLSFTALFLAFPCMITCIPKIDKECEEFARKSFCYGYRLENKYNYTTQSSCCTLLFYEKCVYYWSWFMCPSSAKLEFIIGDAARKLNEMQCRKYYSAYSFACFMSVRKHPKQTHLLIGLIIVIILLVSAAIFLAILARLMNPPPLMAKAEFVIPYQKQPEVARKPMRMSRGISPANRLNRFPRGVQVKMPRPLSQYPVIISPAGPRLPSLRRGRGRGPRRLGSMERPSIFHTEYCVPCHMPMPNTGLCTSQHHHERFNQAERRRGARARRPRH